MGEDLQSNLETRVARLRDETRFTAVTAAVMTDGQLAGVAASGERRRGSAIPVTVDDRWHVGSITKSMTATLLAVLEEDGLLSRDDRLGELLLMLLPAKNTVLAFATNDGALWTAEAAFFALARDLTP